MNDADIIGRSWEIRPPAHVGHTLTVRGRDPIEKHLAFWVDCSCGDDFLVGEHFIAEWVVSKKSIYDVVDAQHWPPRPPSRVVA